MAILTRRCATLLLLFALYACGGGGDSSQTAPPAVSITGARTLSIVPIAQQTDLWCWAATAEMVFIYYGLPNINSGGNYQCGIVAAYYGPSSACASNCFLCQAGIGTLTNMKNLVNNYGIAVSLIYGIP